MPVQATARASHGEEDPRGDSPSPTLMANPYGMPDPQHAGEFENGYTFCQSLGAQGINGAGQQQWSSWAGRPDPWRRGFAQALQGLGLGRLSSTLFSQDQAKAASMTSALIPFGVFGFRDDDDEDTKLAFNLLHPTLGVAGAGVGAGVGGMAGGRLGASFGNNPVTKGIGALAGGALGAGAGGLVGYEAGTQLADAGPQAATGGDGEYGTDAMAGGGLGYGQGMEAKLQDALHKGIISADEADEIRKSTGNTLAGSGRALAGAGVGALGGALAGGLIGMKTGPKPATGGNAIMPIPSQDPSVISARGMQKNISDTASTLGRGAVGAGIGALAGGALGHYMAGRSAGGDRVDSSIGDIIDDDPSRADPQFQPSATNPHIGRAAVGAGLGALAGGMVGSKFAPKFPDGKARSFALPGALAGGALGGYMGYSNPVTDTEPIDKTSSFEESMLDNSEEAAWATELFKVAGMGRDLVGGGIGALGAGAVLGTPIAAPLAAGVIGGNMGRHGYLESHPELTDNERAAVRDGGSLGRSMGTIAAGGLGAMAGGYLGGEGADALTSHGLLPGGAAHVPMLGDVTAHGLGTALGATAGGLGAADVAGRMGAAHDVSAHRGRVALNNAA